MKSVAWMSASKYWLRAISCTPCSQPIALVMWYMHPEVTIPALYCAAHTFESLVAESHVQMTNKKRPRIGCELGSQRISGARVAEVRLIYNLGLDISLTPLTRTL